MVHTPDGPISMEQLQIGTMVLNRDGNYEPVILVANVPKNT